jgi:alpha-beta hydrolase superfamily lysophospholipase
VAPSWRGGAAGDRHDRELGEAARAGARVCGGQHGCRAQRLADRRDLGVGSAGAVDYAYNALDIVTVEAKRIVAEFFGRAPRYSYMLGCSNGGRQAMTLSQRMPLYYDGIVGGSPAMRFSGLAIGQVWNQGVVAGIAPRDAGGRPISSRAFRLGRLAGD